MKPSANYMPPDQFNRVIEAIPLLHLRKWKDEQIEFLFKCAYYMALRPTEAAKLHAESFDLENNRVYLGKTKTEKAGLSIIPALFVPEIDIYLIGKEGELFPGVNRFIIDNWTRRLGKILQIKAWTTPQSVSGEKTRGHIFRKSMAKDMIYGTFDGKKATVSIAMKQLRHKSPVTFFKYIQTDTEDLKNWWAT